jgi:ribosomal protein S5
MTNMAQRYSRNKMGTGILLGKSNKKIITGAGITDNEQQRYSKNISVYFCK